MIDHDPNVIREIGFTPAGERKILDTRKIDPDYKNPSELDQGGYQDSHMETVNSVSPESKMTLLNRLVESRIARIALIAGGVTLGVAGIGGGYIALNNHLMHSEQDSLTPLPTEEIESNYPLFTYQVESGETLSTITTDLYENKAGDDEWVNGFIDNNIINTTEDDRHRDRNTIYADDVLEITLDPEQEVPESIICPTLEDGSEDIILKDSPQCVISND